MIVAPEKVIALWRTLAEALAQAATLPTDEEVAAYLTKAPEVFAEWLAHAVATLASTGGTLLGCAQEAAAAPEGGDGPTFPEHTAYVGRARWLVAPNGRFCLVVDEVSSEAMTGRLAALGGMARALGGEGVFAVVGSLDFDDTLTGKVEGDGGAALFAGLGALVGEVEREERERLEEEQRARQAPAPADPDYPDVSGGGVPYPAPDPTLGGRLGDLCGEEAITWDDSGSVEEVRVVPPDEGRDDAFTEPKLTDEDYREGEGS